MKKIILFVSLLVFVFSSCTKQSQLETNIKKEIKKEAKLNGVKVKFNDINCIELDTIPNEFNGPYLNYSIKANYYLNKANSKINDAQFALKYGGDYLGQTIDELKMEAEQYIKIADSLHNVAAEEYSVHKRKCYIVYIDQLTKIAKLGIRTEKIGVYTYDKAKKDFQLIYHTETNCKERFKKYTE